MWEVWTPAKLTKIYAPVAWFVCEDDAPEYVEYLATTNRVGEVHYNDSAVMPDWDYEGVWAHV